MTDSKNSLNVRIARSILVKLKDKPFSVSSLQACFNARIAAVPPLRKYDRTAMTDDEVRQFILPAILKDPKINWTTLLRKFREGGQACGQERFVCLFRSMKAQIGN